MAGIRDLFSLFYWFDNSKALFVRASLNSSDSYDEDQDEDSNNNCVD